MGNSFCCCKAQRDKSCVEIDGNTVECTSSCCQRSNKIIKVKTEEQKKKLTKTTSATAILQRDDNASHQ